MKIDRNTVTPTYNSFTGFTFGDYHTSQFNIIRTSDGSRYNDETSAAAKDTTITIPGMDGALFMSSQKQTRVFNLKFAYDGLSEEDIFDIREWFASTKEQKLIFDERPYCYYMGKVTGTPKLSHICFDHPTDESRRVYKGEGTVTITCYYPYAKSRQVDATKYPDSAQWKEFYLPAAPTEINNTWTINNIGQMPMPIRIIFTATAEQGTISLDGRNKIYFNGMTTEQAYYYDSELQLIQSGSYVEEGKKFTLELQANNIVLAGDFFNIPVNEHKISGSGIEIKKIDYEYIYY